MVFYHPSSWIACTSCNLIFFSIAQSNVYRYRFSQFVLLLISHSFRHHSHWNLINQMQFLNTFLTSCISEILILLHEHGNISFTRSHDFNVLLIFDQDNNGRAHKQNENERKVKEKTAEKWKYVKIICWLLTFIKRTCFVQWNVFRMRLCIHN